jgi:hypothetical protein
MDTDYQIKENKEDISKKIPYDIITCGPHEHPENHQKRLNEYYKNLESNLNNGN